MSRPVGLRGRLPVRAEGDRFPLKYATEYLTVENPVPDYPIDVSGGIQDFGMMGNDSYGDCASAARFHLDMTTAAAAHVDGPAPTDTGAVSDYVAYTGDSTPPGPGVVLADFLLWLYDHGKIVAFAPLDISDVETIDGFMGDGYGVYVGVNLTDDANDLFNEGQPWTVANGERPDQSDGHCIVKVGADGAGTDAWVTWGAVQKSTSAWSKACVEEAWLVVTTEEKLAAFEPALLEDIESLGGTGGETPPAPAPVPVPQPVPEPPVSPTPEPVPPSPVPDPPSPTPAPVSPPPPVSPPSPEPEPPSPEPPSPEPVSPPSPVPVSPPPPPPAPPAPPSVHHDPFRALEDLVREVEGWVRGEAAEWYEAALAWYQEQVEGS